MARRRSSSAVMAGQGRRDSNGVAVGNRIGDWWRRLGIGTTSTVMGMEWGAVRDMGYGDGDVARYEAKGNINVDGDRKLKLSYGRSG